jgi:arylsulfatase A-like enzyme/tetratricopeptide (TPR) repeat protein
MTTTRKTRLWLTLAACGLAAAVVLWMFVVHPGRTGAGRVGRFWASEGVAKPNVVLITLDTTRADHLACYGNANIRTPVIDALAARGVLFEQAATATPLTLPSHCTIMTGMYPTYHGVRVNGNTALGEEQTTLAELFKGRGYATGAFIAAFVLDGRWGLKQGFDLYDDTFDLTKYKHIDLGAIQKPGNEIMDEALAWLETAKDKPFFAWIHLYDPHSPYEPPEPYRSEYGPRGRAGLYDGEVAFMDEQIGRCVAWLGQSGLDKDTVLLLVGDHGEALGSHGEGTHGFFIYDYAVHVPFIVVTPVPGLHGKRVASQVSTVDVFPTLLDLAGIAAPVKHQGRSLVPLMARPDKLRSVPAYSESMAPNLQFGWSALHSLRTERFKYIEAPREELYDLAADRGETSNVRDVNQDLARKMKDELGSLMTETGRGAPTPQAANLDKDTMERLTALGYIGAPVSAKQALGPSGVLADPKDKLAVFNAVTHAGELFLKNEYAAAAAELEGVVRNEPPIPQAMLVLSNCYVELGRIGEAKVVLDALLKADPESVQGLITLANILLEEKKDDDVLALCKRALSVDERNTQAYNLVGEIYMGRLDYVSALPYLERAVDVEPKASRGRLTLAACLVGLKQFDRAKTLLDEVIRDTPKFPLAHFNLGLLYEEQGRAEAARAEYATEVANYPGEFKARFNLGKILFKLGDRADSLEQMRKVVEIAPKLAEGHLLLARALLYESIPLDEIQTEVETGLALAETNELKALGWFLLADVYNRRGEPNRVRDALAKANAYKDMK